MKKNKWLVIGLVVLMVGAIVVMCNGCTLSRLERAKLIYLDVRSEYPVLAEFVQSRCDAGAIPGDFCTTLDGVDQFMKNLDQEVVTKYDKAKDVKEATDAVIAEIKRQLDALNPPE